MMPRVLTSVLRAGSIYLGFSVLNRAIPFLLIPLLTRFVDPAGYGTIALLGIVTALATPLVGLCTNTVLFQRYHHLPVADRTVLLKDCYVVVVLGACFTLAVCPLFSAPLKSYLGLDLFWFELALICAVAGMILTLASSLLQIKMQPALFGFLQSASAIVNVIATLVFVVALDMSWQGRIWAITLAAIAVAAMSVYLNVRSGDLVCARFREFSQFASVVRLGVALIPSTIAGGVIAMSDRLFLGKMLSLEAVGIYAVGVSFAQITDILLNSLGQAYLPYLYKHGRDAGHNTRLQIVRAVYAIALLSLAVAAMVTLVAPVVIDNVLDSRYGNSKLVVGWLSLSFAFVSIASAFQGLILAVERNGITVYVSMAVLTVSLVGNYLLIGQYGMVGAAMGVALGSFTSVILYALASFKYNPCPWLDKELFRRYRDEIS